LLQPTTSKQDEGFTGNRVSGETSAAREECTTSTSFNHHVHKTTDGGNDEFLESKEYGLILNCEDLT
jgi:hypothetical protein